MIKPARLYSILMKHLIYLILLFTSARCFSQSLEINVEIPYAPVNIQLFRGDSLAASLDTADNRSSYLFRELEPADYSVRLKDSVLKKFTLKDVTRVEITIKNVGPCLFDHTEDYKPECPLNHSDKIIPIIYGMPLPEGIKKAEKGEVLLSTCTDSRDCHPHFYCTIHKTSF